MGGLSRTQWFVEGARQSFLGPAWLVGFGLAGIGGLAKMAGFSLEAAVASTLLIWAGPAQVLFFGGIAAGVALPAIALSISLSSVRLLPMGLSLLPQLRTKSTSLAMQLLASHYIAVTVWTEGMRRVPDVPRGGRMAFYLGFSNICILVSTFMTGAGYLLMTKLPPALGAGLLFLSPVYFVAALLRNARAPADWFALVIGLFGTPIATIVLGPGLDLLAIGLGGGTLAWFLGRKVFKGKTA